MVYYYLLKKKKSVIIANAILDKYIANTYMHASKWNIILG